MRAAELPVEPGALAGAMAGLRQLLAEVAYGELYDLVAGAGLFVTDRRAADRVLRSLPAEERAVLRLLALDQAVERDELSPRLARLAEQLSAAGLARAEGERLRADDLVVVPVLRGLLLTATPPGWRAGAEAHGRAYLGEDSLRLARALPDAAGKRVLDLGAGCGIQGLLALRGARRAVLTDVEPRSLALARCNQLLNGRCEEVEIRAGDAYDPVAGERFDLIACLPPYVPSLPEAQHQAVSGGADGLGLVRRILAGAPAHLTPGGEAVLLAQLLCDDEAPLLARDLEELAPGGEVRIVCSDWHPIQPYAFELAGRLAAGRSEQVGALLEQLVGSFRSQGVTGVCSAFVRLRIPERSAASGPGVARVGGLPRRRPDEVLAPPPGLSFGEDRSLRTARAPGVASRSLQGHVAALLAAFDGIRDVAEAAAVAWGRPEGADPRDLLDQALLQVAALERAGLLEPVAGSR